MFKFTLDKLNYRSLFQLAETVKKTKVDKIEIKITENQDNLPCFSNIVSFIYQILDYEIYFEVWLKNFPHCVINEFCRDHLLPTSENYRGEKNDQCKQCKFYKICSGFPAGYFNIYGEKEVRLIPDLPIEIMIEVESRCNFQCKFCFNKDSFAEGQRTKNKLSTNYIKKIINNISEAGIKVVRFTGGEPMLRKDIFDLLQYAKEKKLEVRLNTNGSLINEKVTKKLSNIVDNVLIPIDSWDKKLEQKITGFNKSLESKIKAIKLLKSQGIPMIRIGTVALEENIVNFDKLSRLVLALPFDEWEFYRPIGRDRNFKDLSKSNINILTNKIFDLKQKTGRDIIIANAVPFCSVMNSYKLNTISVGALFDDGHSRIVIDPRGYAKPHYFIDKNLGNPLNILSAWNHPFMKKIRGLKYLSLECNKCRFKYKCCGGSRYFAKIISKDWFAKDPLIS